MSDDTYMAATMRTLVSARRQLRLRQLDIARQLGVAQQTVSYWERGLFDPPWPHLVCYAQLVGYRAFIALEPLTIESRPRSM